MRLLADSANRPADANCGCCAKLLVEFCVLLALFAGALAGPSASGRLLASWAAPMELEQSAFVKRAQETARTADYTEVQIDE